MFVGSSLYRNIEEVLKQNSDVIELLVKTQITSNKPEISNDFDTILKTKKVLLAANRMVIDRDIINNFIVDVPISIKSKKKSAYWPVNFEVTPESINDQNAANSFFKNVLDIQNKTDSYLIVSYDKQDMKNQSNSISESTETLDRKETNINIVRWLNNTKNRFDYISQEKPINVNETEIPDFNIPSVSQNHNTRKKKFLTISSLADLQKQKIRQKNKRKNTQSKDDKQNPSLKCNKEKVNSTFTFEGTRKEGEEIVIETINKGEVSMVNDQLSATTEAKSTDKTSFNKSSTSSELKDISSKLSNTSDKNKSLPNTSVSSNGWSRIEEFKNTIKRIERKPFKLNARRKCSLQTVAKEKKIINPKIKCKNSRNKNTKSIISKDLNSTSTIENNQQTSSNEKDIKCNNSSSSESKKCEITTLGTAAANYDSSNAEIISKIDTENTTSLKIDNFKIENGQTQQKDIGFSSMNDSNIKQLKKKVHDIFLTDEDVLCLIPNQKDKTKNIDVRNGDVCAHNSACDAVFSEETKTTDKKNIFNELTQSIIIDYNGLGELSKGSVLQKIELLYQLVTILKRQYCDILNVEGQSNFGEETSSFLMKIKNVVDDIQFVVNNDYTLHEYYQVPENIKDIGIQTDFLINTKDAAIQLNSFSLPQYLQHCSTQTSTIKPVTINTFAQTTDFKCKQCNILLCCDTENTVKLTNEKPNNYIFTQSFDNLVFDTQDIIQGKGISIQSSSNVTSAIVKPIITETTNINKSNTDIPQKKCSLDNITLRKINKVTNTKAITSNKKEERKSFKRIRRPSSGSDSEDFLLKGVKKNKYIPNDISIAFMSQSHVSLLEPNEDIDLKSKINKTTATRIVSILLST